MEPVELNTGVYQLRQFRADDRVDDRPALVEAFADPLHQRFVPGITVDTPEAAEKYLAHRASGWARGERCSWAVASAATGALLGEVGLKALDLHDGRAEAAVWVHPMARGRGVAVTALSAALRFGFGTLGLRSVDYLHEPGNHPSAAVARRCGFTYRGADRNGVDVRWTRNRGSAT